MSANKEKSEQDKKINDIEKRIEEVMDLLALPKDIFEQDFNRVLANHAKTRQKTELAYVSGSKHKNLTVREHAKGNLDLVKALRTKQKYDNHPVDLLSHLDSLTDKLLLLVQAQGQNKRPKKEF